MNHDESRRHIPGDPSPRGSVAFQEPVISAYTVVNRVAEEGSDRDEERREPRADEAEHLRAQLLDALDARGLLAERLLVVVHILLDVRAGAVFQKREQALRRLAQVGVILELVGGTEALANLVVEKHGRQDALAALRVDLRDELCERVPRLCDVNRIPAKDFLSYEP